MTQDSLWYVAVDGRQEGPLPLSSIVARVQSGTLDPRRAHVFCQGMANWEPMTTRAEFSSRPGAMPAASTCRMRPPRWFPVWSTPGRGSECLTCAPELEAKRHIFPP